LAAVVCLASAGTSGETQPSDKPVLCTPQPRGPGGVPVTLAAWAEGARLFQQLGDFHRQVSTNSPDAQAYFDQGMRFLWTFNHDEATSSFAKAAAQQQFNTAWKYADVTLTASAF
jgi:hypothetical protein